MAAAGEPLVEMDGISKRFFGVRALDAVSFTVGGGEVHALVGENGAGKSTLIKILGGALRPDSGAVRIDGRAVSLRDPRHARALGIAVVHQDVELVPALSVAENVCLGDIPGRGFGVLRLLVRADVRRRAREVFDRLGLDLPLDRPIGTLGLAERQLVQIATALSARARVLVLDEPTASLEPRETEKLFVLIRRLRAEGTGVVFISHRIAEVLMIADRVTVLRDGRVVASCASAALTPPSLIQLIVGRRLDQLYPKVGVTVGPELLRVDELRLGPAGPAYRFTVREGEILAFTGLLGAGCTELLNALYGARPASHRAVRVGGRPARLGSPSRALRAGLGLLPEDRLAQGLVPDLSIAENIVLSSLSTVTRRGLVSRRRMRDIAGAAMRALEIRAPDASTPVKLLSGGNQQKVLIARLLASGLRVLAMEEPTHGVDVGARAEIHRLMGEYVARGNGILFVSSEFPEVLGLGDRIVVLHRGEVVAELPAGEASEEVLLARAAGVAS